MTLIVLATLNARYHHCAFGLRYLLANMGQLRCQTELVEFTINQPALEIVDAILARQPRIVGLGVYIWNADETLRVVADLKRVAPDVIVVLGGPEVSYETDQQEICRLADFVISGEADLEFAVLCNRLLSRGSVGHSIPMTALASRNDAALKTLEDKPTTIIAPIAALNTLQLPYELYSDEDIAHRVIYVEASRGCPYTCEFCLSALDIPVRQFDLEPFLQAMETLLSRGATVFKFVDRTFNLNIRVSRSILEFFLKCYRPGMFLHFELIPDRLPDSLKEVIAQFPPGALQFEVGIQTFNDDVSDLISRRQDNLLVDQNLRWLKEKTSAHIHADLIVGLPGESLESFAAGFDRLVGLSPHEIQIGILKRLRGTPIVRHDEPWNMVYSPHPPYEILQTSLLPFSIVQELRRFAKYWDTIANSGNFVETTSMLWSPGDLATNDAAGHFAANPGMQPTPFESFRRLSIWLYERERILHGISLSRLVELLFEYLTQVLRFEPEVIAQTLWQDYRRGGRSDKPACLRPYLSDARESASATRTDAIPKRQSRRLSVSNETPP